MPWKASTRMSQRQEFVELARQENANIRALCREFGITPRTGYKWIKRYQEEGEHGLYDRSRRPQHSPFKSSVVMEEAVLKVRRAHPAWGGRKIQWKLVQEGITSPAASTITAILSRHEMLDPVERTKHSPMQRFEMAYPNQLWQMDFKGHFEMANGLLCHPLTVIDDHSRFLVGLKACPYQHSRAVREHLKDIFGCYGVPERMLMDNGAIWKGFHTKLTSWLVRLGIQVVHGRIHHPQTQGKDERLHRTLKNELLTRQPFYDLNDCQSKFDVWRNSYNHERPHQALDMQIPSSRYQPSPRTFTGSFPPIEYEAGDILRKTDCLGKLQYQGRKFRIGKAFKKSLVALRPTEIDGVLNVFFFKQRIAQINLLTDNPA
ncbi:MAG: IS481 family transposase [Anaerolineae bacterium]|nr:IS481 family transposase [Anaerolineae bacterium]